MTPTRVHRDSPPGRKVAVPVARFEGRLALAMSALQGSASAMRELADALAGLVAELGTQTAPDKLRDLATGLAANATRATLTALNTRGAADTLASIGFVLEHEGPVSP
jgi:hypothetical protein